MSEIPNKRRAKVYTIHSQKGGVGKTSIAITIAALEAIFHEKKVLIIDADLTGTSLLDNVPICGSKSSVHYFNDLIMGSPTEFERCTSVLSRRRSLAFSKYCHKTDQLLNVFIMPGSPLLEDIKKIVPLISQEDFLHFFRHRLEDIIVTAINDNYDIIIIDHSPGLYGLSLASLQMMIKESHEHGLGHMCRAKTEGIDIEACAVLITTTDKADYTAFIPSFLEILEGARSTEEKDSILDRHYLFINKAGAAEGVTYDPALMMGRIFANLEALGGHRTVKNEHIELLKKSVVKSGVNSSGYIDSFDMSKITSYVKSLKEVSRDETIKPDSTQGWCKEILKACRIDEEYSHE